MKCYTQVYVMNSIEPVETYCRAFGAKVTFEIKNDVKNAFDVPSNGGIIIKQFMRCRGTNAAPPLLIDMVCVGGLQFNGQSIVFFM